MAGQVATTQTTLPGEEVIVRAVQFFTSENWRATTQSARSVTFEGKQPIPCLLLALTIIGFFFFFVPGLIMYFFVIKKMYRFENLVVTANPIPSGTEVVVTYPSRVKKLVDQFIDSLPKVEAKSK